MKLKLKEKLGYGFGEFAGSGLWQTMMFFLPVFYTDVFLLPASAVATLFIVVRIFDAANDPIMGAIADRTTTRWGKFRPYILFGSFPLGALTVMMFTVPDLQGTEKIIYAYGTYFLLLVFYTLVMVPLNSMVAVMSSDPLERTSLVSYKFVFAYVAGIAVQGLLIPLVDKLGAGDSVLGYQLTMGGLAIVCIIALMIVFFTTKERVKPDKKLTSSLSIDLKDLTNNKPWLIVFAYTIISLIYIGIRSTSVVYYFQYYIERKDLASIFLVSGTLAVLIGVLPTKYLTKKFGKRQVIIGCMSIIGISLVVNFFAAPEDIFLIFFTQITFSLASGPTMPLIWAMLADTADYSEWTNGRRATGLIYSAATMGTKTGVAIGAALTLSLFSYSGYVPNVDQTAESLMGIRMSMTIIPAVIALLSILTMVFYSLSEEKLEKIEAELQISRDASLAVTDE